LYLRTAALANRNEGALPYGNFVLSTIATLYCPQDNGILANEKSIFEFFTQPKFSLSSEPPSVLTQKELSSFRTIIFPRCTMQVDQTLKYISDRFYEDNGIVEFLKKYVEIPNQVPHPPKGLQKKKKRDPL